MAASPLGALPAAEVHARLRDALVRLDTARGESLLWFSEVHGRRLYRAFGCSSIYQYARAHLGFSRAQTGYYLRVVRRFEELPALRAALASGSLGWTAAREIVRVATARTVDSWIEAARNEGRRSLERKVAEALGRARRRVKAPGQQELAVSALVKEREPCEGLSTITTQADPGPAGGAGERRPSPPDAEFGSLPSSVERDALPVGASATPEPVVEVPVTVSLRFSPEQYARLEALMERARRLGARGSREELLLSALEEFSGDVTTANDHPGGHSDTNRDVGRGGMPEGTPVSPSTRTAARETASAHASQRNPPRYQVVVHQCASCGRAELPTSRGPQPVDAVTLRTILCDARVLRPGKRNRATIPPSVRREVLARDRHRCRAPGCGSSRFLDVHHRTPRSAGGSNDATNLITLCSACHRLVHERGLTLPRVE